MISASLEKVDGICAYCNNRFRLATYFSTVLLWLPAILWALNSKYGNPPPGVLSRRWRVAWYFSILLNCSSSTECLVCRCVVTVSSFCKISRNRPMRVSLASTSDHLRLCRYSKLSRASRRSASGLISLSFVNSIASSMRSFYFLFVPVVHPFPRSVEGCLGICLLPSSWDYSLF